MVTAIRFERHRNKGLPPVVDIDVLLRAGISDSLVPRTLQAMKTLDLLTEEGRPSEVFEGLRLAPSVEHKERMAEWLNAAYADALTFIDPATDDEVAIRDAFRKYIPTGQQSRMISLFMGLFTAAGVMPPRAKAVALPKKPAVGGVRITHGSRVFRPGKQQAGQQQHPLRQPQFRMKAFQWRSPAFWPRSRGMGRDGHREHGTSSSQLSA